MQRGANETKTNVNETQRLEQVAEAHANETTYMKYFSSDMCCSMFVNRGNGILVLPVHSSTCTQHPSTSFERLLAHRPPARGSLSLSLSLALISKAIHYRGKEEKLNAFNFRASIFDSFAFFLQKYST